MGGLTVAQAIHGGLTISRANDGGMKRMLSAAEQFKAFLRATHPDLWDWARVTTAMCREYVMWLAARDVGANCTRNYLTVLRLAANYAMEMCPESARPIRFCRLVPQSPFCPKRFLTAARLRACIACAEGQDDHTAKLALVLGGLAGLRLQEIARIRHESLRGDGLWIVDSKNRYSTRLIPILPEVREYLAAFLSFHRVWPYHNFETFCKAVRRVLTRMLEGTGDETYRLVLPHDCARKTFVNLAVQAGVGESFCDCYIGHAPRSTAGLHYRDLTPRADDLPDYRELKLDVLRREVVGPLSKFLENSI